MPRFASIPVTVNGRTYPSIGKAAKGEGVAFNTMWHRVKGKTPDITIGEALLRELQRRAARGLPLAGVRVHYQFDRRSA
jgi:hypothetical protein